MTTLKEYRERLPHISYSSLNQLMNICPLQFYLQRIERVKPTHRSLPLVFGGVTHNLIEFVNRRRMEAKPFNVKDAEELWTELWRGELGKKLEIHYGKKTPEEAEDMGRKCTQCFIENIDPGEEVLAVNEVCVVPLTLMDGTVSDKVILAEMDAIVRTADGRKELREYKTGARKWSPAQLQSNQVTFYQMAWHMLHPDDPVGFSIHLITKTKVPQFHAYNDICRTEDDFKRLRWLIDRAEKLVDTGVQHLLPNSSSFACADCPYGHRCAEIHRSTKELAA